MTDGRDVPRKDDGRLRRDLKSLGVGVRRVQFPSGCERDDAIIGEFVRCVCRRSVRTDFPRSLKLRRDGEDGAKAIRSGPEGVEKGASMELVWPGVRIVSFGTLGDQLSSENSVYFYTH